MHDAFHVAFSVVFLAALAIGFLGLIRPLLDGGDGWKLPGPRATALLFLGVLAAAATDWILHRYVL